MNPEVMVFIALFLVVGGCFITIFISRYKQDKLRQKTLQKALEVGQQLTPELLESLGKTIDTGVRDYRRGVLITLFGATALIVSLVADIPGEARQVFPYLSLFPLLIGIGYLIVWKTQSGKR
jgi:hypothetical protein